MCHISNIPACFLRGFPEDRNCPPRRLREPGQRAQQRRLACSVLAKDRVESSRIEFRGHSAQRGKTPKLLDHVEDGDDRCGGVGHGRGGTSVKARVYRNAGSPCTRTAKCRCLLLKMAMPSGEARAID